MTARSRALLVSLLVAFVAACSSDPNPSSKGAGGAGSSGSGFHLGAGGNGVAGGIGTGGASGSAAAGGAATAGFAGSLGVSGSGVSGNGGAGGGGSGASGGGVATAGAAGSAGVVNCETLFPQSSAALAAARECNPALGSQQCTQTLTDVCGCQYPVNAANAQAIAAYGGIAQGLTARGCVLDCSGEMCMTASPATCQPSSASSTGGVCRATL